MTTSRSASISDPDPKPPAKVRDPDLLRRLHLEWQECALCFATEYSFGRLSLHHISKHPRDDLRENLVMLCGDGTRGCHGLIEAKDAYTCRSLLIHIRRERLDTMTYLAERFGDAHDWLHRHLGVESA